MSPTSPAGVENAKQITVRYWAAARAAAGTEQDVVEVSDVRGRSLASVLDEVIGARPGNRRFADVVGICSVLVGEVPVGARPQEEVMLHGGETVELLPPFAGG